MLLCRSAWAGSQRYGAAVWSGDIPATWESLRQQVRAGLNIAISGIPWWTTDIGGFHGGDPADPAYQELIVRWFQYGVFCPLFRLHGDRLPRVPTGHAMTGGPNEAWSYGDAAYERIAAALRLRERLRPYIHEQMRAASGAVCRRCGRCSSTSRTTRGAWQAEDQFLFGPDLLIAPVLEPGATDTRGLPARGPLLDRGRDRRAARRAAPPSGSAHPDRIPVFVAKEPRFLMSSAKQGGPVRPSTSVWRPLGPDEITRSPAASGQQQAAG